MTTSANALGSSPPIPSAPPLTIYADSPSEDVKLWVWHCLMRNDAYLTEQEAWELARKVKGSGNIVQYYNKESWEKQVPDWGETIYISLQQSQKWIPFLSSTWSFKRYCSSWLEGVGLSRSLKKKTSNKPKTSESPSLHLRSSSESFTQSHPADGLTKIRDFQDVLNSAEEGTKAYGRISQEFLSNEQNSSTKRLPFQQEID